MMNDITVADSRHHKNITIIFSSNNPIKNSGCIYPSLLLVLQYNYRMFSLLLPIFAIRRLSIAYSIKSMRLGMCCSYHHTAGSVYFWVLRQSSSSENTNQDIDVADNNHFLKVSIVHCTSRRLEDHTSFGKFYTF